MTKKGEGPTNRKDESAFSKVGGHTVAVKWERRPHRVTLEFVADNGETLECRVPITERQYEACVTLDVQNQFNRVNPIYDERVKRWLMMDLRRYRRYLGQPSLGPIIPVDMIRISGLDDFQQSLF